MEPFGQRLRLRRREAGLSRMSIAKHLGVHLNTVANWEARKAPPSNPMVVLDLAKLLGVSFEWLVTGIDESNVADLPLAGEG